jgi:glycosyltransferase involved in cell wall biosynthesis
LLEDLSRRGLSGDAHFTGAVPPHEVPRLLAGMDAAVAPYSGRGSFYFSPLKVYEYMAAGLPVVASRLGQLDGLIGHGVTGLLCPPDDAGALAGALARLRSAPDLRRRLGEAARAAVLRQHTWAAVAGRILRLAEATPTPGLVAGGREVS